MTNSPTLRENLSKDKLINEILLLLRGKQIDDCAEVLANVFLELGVSNTKIKEKMNMKNIARIIFDDLDKNGETLGNSLARQGLLILSWLNRET
jgi:hypothetical protein